MLLSSPFPSLYFSPGWFIGQCLPYSSVGILHTWDSFLREIAAPRICESVVDEDLIYFKPHESVRLELEESLLVGACGSVM